MGQDLRAAARCPAVLGACGVDRGQLRDASLVVHVLLLLLLLLLLQFPQIPHYHLVEATEAAKKVMGPYYRCACVRAMGLWMRSHAYVPWMQGYLVFCCQRAHLPCQGWDHIHGEGCCAEPNAHIQDLRHKRCWTPC